MENMLKENTNIILFIGGYIWDHHIKDEKGWKELVYTLI